MFPIPSNFNVGNLYAVLIVQKVVASDSDVDIYLKPGKSSESKESLPQNNDVDQEAKRDNLVDLEKCKTKAEKASSRRSHFLVPFAFWGCASSASIWNRESYDSM